jgi:hypothetical protein
MKKTLFFGLRWIFLAASIYVLFFVNNFLGLLIAFGFYFLFKSCTTQQGFLFKETFKSLFQYKWRTLLLVLTFIFIAYLSTLFRVRSNIQYAFSNQGALIVLSNQKFQLLGEEVKSLDLEVLHQNDDVVISQLSFTRMNQSLYERVKDKFIAKKLFIFEFNLKNEFGLCANVERDCQPMNCIEAKNRSKSKFVLNTSFYGLDSKGLNEIIIDKKNYGGRNATASGFFKVIDGKPYAGPKSIFSSKKGTISHSCQAFPSVMKDGIIFNYIESEIAQSKVSWKMKTYRNLLGTKANGNLVCIVSNEGGLISVKEISQIAKIYGVEHATLFDGGSALQYSFDDRDWSCTFSAIANSGYVPGFIKRILSKRAKSTIPARSPVYLYVR